MSTNSSRGCWTRPCPSSAHCPRRHGTGGALVSLDRSASIAPSAAIPSALCIFIKSWRAPGMLVKILDRAVVPTRIGTRDKPPGWRECCPARHVDRDVRAFTRLFAPPNAPTSYPCGHHAMAIATLSTSNETPEHLHHLCIANQCRELTSTKTRIPETRHSGNSSRPSEGSKLAQQPIIIAPTLAKARLARHTRPLDIP